MRFDDNGDPTHIDPATLLGAVESLVQGVHTELGHPTGQSRKEPGTATHNSQVHDPGCTTPYARKALDNESAELATTLPGSRNDTLNRAAFNLGTLIGAGELDERLAESELLAAATSCGLNQSEADRTIQSGFKAGKQRPRTRQSAPSVIEHGPVSQPTEPPDPELDPLMDYAPFPTELFPEPLRSFVNQGSAAIGCDESFIALPLLSVLASAVGNTMRLEVKPGWAEPHILWTAVIGDSGSMKTPAFALATRPIQKIQDRAFKEYNRRVTDWEAQTLLYEANLSNWKRDASRGEAGPTDPPRKPETPTPRRFTVSDTTTEALAPILLANPRGVLLSRDELSGWLSSFDRYAKSGRAGGDMSHWLSMHTATPMTVDRKSATPPTLHIPCASVCITGCIQPAILARLFTREHHESGMAARLLYAMPPRRLKRWSEAHVSPNIEDAVQLVIERLLALEPEDAKDGDTQPHLVKLSPDAKKVFTEFYNAHALEQFQMTGDLSAAWSKLEGYAVRLALLIHMARWAGDDSTLKSWLEVDAESMSRGITLSRWFGREAKRVFETLSESAEAREDRRLLELVRRHDGSLSARELVQQSRMFRRVADAEIALKKLAEAGYGTWHYPKSDGPGAPKAARFTLKPAYGANVYKTPADTCKNGHSVDVDGIDKAAAPPKDLRREPT